MTSNIHSFLQAVLGADAAMALKKAASRSESLNTVLGARVIVGWLDLASRWGYEGEVPGLQGSYFRFQKSEDNDLFEGEVRFGKDAYSFVHVDLPHVAAGLSVALGADQLPDEDLRDADLSALGQNIDLLLKTQVIKEITSPEESSSSNSCECSHCETSGCDCSCHHDLEKGGGTTAPGEAAPQKPPSGPVGKGFTPPKLTQPRRSQKKGFGTKLTMSQAASKCSVCGAPQFQGDLFLGCYCLRDLAKHATVSADPSGYHLEFDPAYWTRDDVTVLMDIVSEGA